MALGRGYLVIVAVSVVLALSLTAVPFAFFGVHTSRGHAYAWHFSNDAFARIATTSALCRRVPPERPYLSGHGMPSSWLAFVWPAYLHECSGGAVSVCEAVILATMIAAALFGATIAAAAGVFVRSPPAALAVVVLALLADSYQWVGAAVGRTAHLAPVAPFFERLAQPEIARYGSGLIMGLHYSLAAAFALGAILLGVPAAHRLGTRHAATVGLCLAGVLACHAAFSVPLLLWFLVCEALCLGGTCLREGGIPALWLWGDCVVGLVVSGAPRWLRRTLSTDSGRLLCSQP
jgi:drug/metabolite transporter superfamily protein YnfA